MAYYWPFVCTHTCIPIRDRYWAFYHGLIQAQTYRGHTFQKIQRPALGRDRAFTGPILLGLGHLHLVQQIHINLIYPYCHWCIPLTRTLYHPYTALNIIWDARLVPRTPPLSLSAMHYHFVLKEFILIFCQNYETMRCIATNMGAHNQVTPL